MTIAQRESLSLRLAAPSPLNHVVTREEEVVVKYLRKGRFDEIFFADLPHATDGFTGAEIDQIVNSAIYAACVAGDGLGAEWLMQEAKTIYPLSKTMKEDIDRMRERASFRARSTFVDKTTEAADNPEQRSGRRFR